jgi:rhodanese-related sulfurtransferase
MKWYHDFETIHELWKADYFDYVLDVRSLEDFSDEFTGWETSHIPGSYPVKMSSIDCSDSTSGVCDPYTLDEFRGSDICRDARIFVHCWTGILGNAAAKTLVSELGFTNVHAAGPQGNAGFNQWDANEWEIKEGDTYKAEKLVPECAKICME